MTKRTVRRWSQRAEETLWGCFEAASWDVLCEPHGDDINATAECVTSVWTTPSPPIMNSGSPVISPTRKREPLGRDSKLLRSVQKELKVRIRDNKEVYRRKLESKIQLNNVWDVWSGMQRFMVFKQKEDWIEESLDRANEMNSFLNRFSPKTSSASSSPAPGQTDLPPSLDPQLLCYISAVSFSTSLMDLTAAPMLSPTSGDDAPPLHLPPTTSPSLAVRCRNSWRD